MNYSGSYKKLLGNAKAAMIAAIEIYNKPAFTYRDECVVILLINAWELALKAVLSKNRKSIFYPKKRKQPYRTLSWRDALKKAHGYLPTEMRSPAIQLNIELLATYRDHAIHFYNAVGFSTVIYALAQTAIKNFRDLLEAVFGHRLEEEINWQILPLGINPPIDVIDYLGGRTAEKKTDAVRQFLSELQKAQRELEEADEDTGRLLTVFDVQLVSVKKIGDQGVVVAVEKADSVNRPLSILKPQDPNITHPLRQKDIVASVGERHGQKFTNYTFQAIARKYKLKENKQYCWQAREGVLVKYSNDVIPFIRRLSRRDINAAVREYKQYMSSARKNK